MVAVPRTNPAPLIAAVMVLAAATALGAPFPSRRGDSGLLDVPDADLPVAAHLATTAEARFESAVGHRGDLSPSQISIGVGLGAGLELGLALREGGQLGDPRPSPLLVTGTLKLHLANAAGWRPDLAASVAFDRLNLAPAGELRLIASTPRIGRVRFAGFAGGVIGLSGPVDVGPSAGLAASILIRADAEAVVETLATARGLMLSGAVRWSYTSRIGFSLGLGWLPMERAVQVSFGIGAQTDESRRLAPAPEPVLANAPELPVTPAAAPLDERPRFRLRIATRMPPESGGTHGHYPRSHTPPSLPGVEPGAGGAGRTVAGPALAKGEPPTPAPFARRSDGAAVPLQSATSLALRFLSSASLVSPADGTALDDLVDHSLRLGQQDQLVWLLTSAGVDQAPEAARRALEVANLAANRGLDTSRVRVQLSTPAPAASGVEVRVLLAAVGQAGTALPGSEALAAELPMHHADGTIAPRRVLKATRLALAAPGAPQRAGETEALRNLGREARELGASVFVWTAVPANLQTLPDAARRIAAIAGAVATQADLPADRVFLEISQRQASGQAPHVLVVLVAAAPAGAPTPILETPEIPEAAPREGRP